VARRPVSLDRTADMKTSGGAAGGRAGGRVRATPS
jgi:hypothetical protein